ncbi:hypothetical protein KFK09_007137 [Dendrobium nobile]|uniref:Uncharacterized protein n=1 Tax=Dendrobium nobile TaxID=94219 RepID=A0A8T3BR44_DENNO|nr:hypothetical protein KFK09_007137 [Dendrobium nobile]
MKLLDEFNDLNKNHKNLKSSYVELEKEFKDFKDDLKSREHYLNFDKHILKDVNTFLKLKVEALKKNRIPPTLECFTNPILHPKFLKLSGNRQNNYKRLRNPFLELNVLIVACLDI